MFFRYFTTTKKSFYFTFIRFYFRSFMFFNLHRFIIKFIFNAIADSIPSFIKFFKQFIIFYQKNMLISQTKCFPRPLIFGRIICNGLTIALVFITNKVFIIISAGRNLTRYDYFINIFFNFDVIECYNFFIHLLYLIIKIYVS